MRPAPKQISTAGAANGSVLAVVAGVATWVASALAIFGYCWELDGDNDAIARATPFTFHPNGAWTNDDDNDVAVSGINVGDDRWEYDGDGDLVLKAV